MKRTFLVIVIVLFMFWGCQDNEYTLATPQVNEEIASDILIDIKGAVKYPGVYSISSSSLIKDVIEMAGGFLENADTTNINMVKTITSNEMIVIPFKRDTIINNGLKININTATVKELMTIPKIGEAKAQAIINYRNKQGFFTSIDDLVKVSGISETIINQIKAYITIS